VNQQRLAEVFLQRGETPEWRNTLSFLFGRLLSAFSEPTQALDLLQTRLDGPTESDTRLLLVLADAAQMLTGKGITLRSDLFRRLQDLLLKVMTGPAVVVTRSEAGSALGRLGDPRFRADRFWLPDEDLLGFIRVEAGAFTMGSDPRVDPYASDDEQPQHSVELPEYYIARYPVTVAQFQAFVVDSGFEVGVMDCLRGVPNHPVVYVSVYEALAYCAWLTERLKRVDWTPPLLRDQLADGWAITLPSEAEWEKAARGRDGRIYPWGNKFDNAKVNSRQTGLDRLTSSVGIYPEGASPCNALDMSGNVWEWTRSLWGEYAAEAAHRYPYDVNDAEGESLNAPDTIARVQRGGSFGNSEGLLRAAVRDREFPVSRVGSGGFRSVCSRVRP
jgi:formylglycine-generating enzyme required for sulfatase activity